MRKLFYLFSLFSAIVFTSCEKQPKVVGVPNNLVVENTISTDREGLYVKYGGDYRWFETQILLKDFLDDECDGDILSVTSVYQVITEKDNGADVNVVMTTHTPEGSKTEVFEGFWVEDFALNEEAIKITFKEAFDKIMQCNYPKPHSRHCVLRKQVGPKDANPQYIFGNTRSQLYVDAVTGEVTAENPAFNTPLGEWP